MARPIIQETSAGSHDLLSGFADATLLNAKDAPVDLAKSPLRYPGGKSRAVSMILGLLPAGIKTLASPFLGGGSIELAVASHGVKVYGYDIFKPLVL
ncbi:MAG: DNA adenine methylase, partial [Proteobacteria bacterium]|nr:DNA adenine methylase [Pseudomonadota bacterium]